VERGLRESTGLAGCNTTVMLASGRSHWQVVAGQLWIARVELIETLLLDYWMLAKQLKVRYF